MGNFCKYCGKQIENGEVCNCQTSQEKKVAYVGNAMDGKTYSFVSSSFMCASLIPYQGKVFTDIEVDGEKMNIKITPKRRNKVPTVYFKDIREVNVSVKLSIYLIFVAIIFALIGLVNPVFLLVALIWVWIAVNRKVTITLANGQCVDIYSNAKAPAIEFADELGKVIKK